MTPRRLWKDHPPIDGDGFLAAGLAEANEMTPGSIELTIDDETPLDVLRYRRSPIATVLFCLAAVASVLPMVVTEVSIRHDRELEEVVRTLHARDDLSHLELRGSVRSLHFQAEDLKDDVEHLEVEIRFLQVQGPRRGRARR